MSSLRNAIEHRLVSGPSSVRSSVDESIMSAPTIPATPKSTAGSHHDVTADLDAALDKMRASAAHSASRLTAPLTRTHGTQAAPCSVQLRDAAGSWRECDEAAHVGTAVAPAAWPQRHHVHLPQSPLRL